MKIYFLGIMCSILLLGSLGWSEDSTDPAFSKEYFSRITENNKVFLWKIGKFADDEVGFKSLRQLDESDGNSVISQETQIHGLTFTINDVSYRLENFDTCSIISEASKKIKSILKSKIMCALDIRGSEPYILVIGDNTNEIVKEIKNDKENDTRIIPSWYDYQVIN